MLAPTHIKEPGSLITLNGYTFLPYPAVQNPNGSESLPAPTIIALHQQTHEEFIVSKIPKTQLNSQKYALIGNELKVSQQLRGLPNLRILCDVIDYEDHLFLFYSAPQVSPKNQEKDQAPKAQSFSKNGSIISTPNNREMNLLDYLKQVKKVADEEEARFIFGQVVKCLMDCHERNVVHRDLKLPAVFINPITRHVRLGDFSQAAILERPDQLLSDRKGSPAYVSPEILIGKPYQPMQSDNWALGIILYALLSGTFPFLESTPKQLFEKILGGQMSFPEDSFTLTTCQLIRGLLRSDPNQRFTANHVLNHDWFIRQNNHHMESDEDDDQMVPEMD